MSPPVVVFRLLLLASGTPAWVALATGGWLQALLRLEGVSSAKENGFGSAENGRAERMIALLLAISRGQA